MHCLLSWNNIKKNQFHLDLRFSINNLKKYRRIFFLYNRSTKRIVHVFFFIVDIQNQMNSTQSTWPRTRASLTIGCAVAKQPSHRGQNRYAFGARSKSRSSTLDTILFCLLWQTRSARALELYHKLRLNRINKLTLRVSTWNSALASSCSSRGSSFALLWCASPALYASSDALLPSFVVPQPLPVFLQPKITKIII